jgi:hypothetical protein
MVGALGACWVLARAEETYRAWPTTIVGTAVDDRDDRGDRLLPLTQRHLGRTC